jgi:hypothetical protein
MLADPDLGVTRISYVGLSAREVACLAATAKARGMDAEIERDATGQIHVTVAAAAPPDQTAPRPAGVPTTRLRRRAQSWLRAWGLRLRVPFNRRAT